MGPTTNLPNDRAYAETCAAVGGIFWNARLLAATGAARYADWLETSLYNGALVGVSPDGAAYFYANPLAADPQPTRSRRRTISGDCTAAVRSRRWAVTSASRGTTRPAARPTSRVCCWACRAMSTGCRPTLCGCTNTCRVGWRRRCLTAVRSACGLRRSYPWDGDVDLVVEDAPHRPVELRLRIPAWATGTTLEVDGVAQDVESGAYAAIRRTWAPGTLIRLRLTMEVRLVASHPRVQTNTGRVAIARGPLVYCVEAADHPEADLDSLVLRSSSDLRADFDADLLGGLTVISGQGGMVRNGQQQGLYAPFEGGASVMTGSTPLSVIPYFAWANRTPGAMRVWIPYVDTLRTSPIQTDLFTSGTLGYHTFRIPALVVTTSGTLLAFAEGRRNSRHDTGAIDIVLTPQHG